VADEEVPVANGEVTAASASASGRGAEPCGFQLLVVAVSGNREHRRDAHDTLDTATCVPLGPSEKYHRRPLRVPDPIYLSVYLNRRSLARYRLVRVRGREPTWDL
jgi:hypothetical protein